MVDVRQTGAISTEGPTGWALTFKDVTQGVTKTTTVHYGVGATFSQGEWIQEDPAPLNGSSSGTDLPYPKTSTVQISGLLVNTIVPTLDLEDGEVLMAPNGISLAPSAMTDDSFYFSQPTGTAKEYLDAVWPGTAAINLLNASFGRWSHISKADKKNIVAEASRMIGESASALTTLSFPTDAKQNADLLLQSIRTFQKALLAWNRSGLALHGAEFDRQRATSDAPGQIGVKVRADLGLPP